MAVFLSKNEGSNIHGIPNIGSQNTFLTAEVAKVVEVGPSDDGAIHKKLAEIVEPKEIANDKEEDWNLKGILAVKEVEASIIRGTMGEVQEKYRLADVELHSYMLAIVPLAERNMVLRLQVMKQEQTLVEVEQ